MSKILPKKEEGMKKDRTGVAYCCRCWHHGELQKHHIFPKEYFGEKCRGHHDLGPRNQNQGKAYGYTDFH